MAARCHAIAGLLIRGRRQTPFILPDPVDGAGSRGARDPGDASSRSIACGVCAIVHARLRSADIGSRRSEVAAGPGGGGCVGGRRPVKGATAIRRCMGKGCPNHPGPLSAPAHVCTADRQTADRGSDGDFESACTRCCCCMLLPFGDILIRGNCAAICWAPRIAPTVHY
jgi:hypothetical protein